MDPDILIKKKKVDLKLLNDCIERCIAGGVGSSDAYITYNGYQKDKHKITKEEYLLIRRYMNNG